jgi:hypothetical protein
MFERQENGDVKLWKEGAPYEGDPVPVQNIPASEWASIVASVSREGETSETFRQALEAQVPK